MNEEESFTSDDFFYLDDVGFFETLIYVQQTLQSNFEITTHQNELMPNLIRLSLVFMFANWYLLSREERTALIGMRTIMTARPAKDATPRYPNKK